jgi:hypothetical protein
LLCFVAIHPSSSSSVDDAAMVDIPEERDPEAARLQLEFMRKRMRQAEKAKDAFETTPEPVPEPVPEPPVEVPEPVPEPLPEPLPEPAR